MSLANISHDGTYSTLIMDVGQASNAPAEPTNIENGRKVVSRDFSIMGMFKTSMLVSPRTLTNSGTGEEILENVEMIVQDANAVQPFVSMFVEDHKAFTTPWFVVPPSMSFGQELDYPELRPSVPNISYSHSFVSSVLEVFSNTGDGESAIKEVLVAPVQGVQQYWVNNNLTMSIIKGPLCPFFILG